MNDCNHMPPGKPDCELCALRLELDAARADFYRAEMTRRLTTVPPEERMRAELAWLRHLLRFAAPAEQQQGSTDGEA